MGVTRGHVLDHPLGPKWKRKAMLRLIIFFINVFFFLINKLIYFFILQKKKKNIAKKYSILYPFAPNINERVLI